MPVYNEAAAIADAVEDVRRFVFDAVPDCELIVVDDGSTDRTAELLDEASGKDTRIMVVGQQNAGHGPALLTGIEAAKGGYLFFLDGDRQVSLENFRSHWALVQADDLDALLGIRARRQDPPHRLIVSRLMRQFIRLSFGRTAADPGVPYKIIRRAVWDRMGPNFDATMRIPSVLAAIFLLQQDDLRIAERPVVHKARQSGRSTLNLPKLARICWNAMFEIAAMRAILRKGRKPALEAPDG